MTLFHCELHQGDTSDHGTESVWFRPRYRHFFISQAKSEASNPGLTVMGHLSQ